MKKTLPNRAASLKGDSWYSKGRWHRAFFLKIMKIATVQIFLIALTLSVSIAREAVSQEILDRKVSLSLKSSTLKDALTALEDKAKVKFVYSASALELTFKNWSLSKERFGSN